MGFKRISLELNGDKLVYRAGDAIFGIVLIDVDQPVTLGSIRVWLVGETLTKWTESETHTSVSLHGGSIIPHLSSSSRDMIGRDSHVNLAYTVWGKKATEKGPNNVLEAGSYRFKFRMLVPKDGLRPSFEGRHGATRYFLKILINRSFPHFDVTRYRCITLLCDLDINSPIYLKSCERNASKQISKVLGIGNAGNLSISASTDKSGYCAGETIYVTCEFKNESTRTLGKPVAKLVQRSVFHASGKSVVNLMYIRAIEGDPMLPGDVRRWVEQPILIDAVPPSRPYGLINVFYSIELRVSIPFGIDLVFTVPITIGTVPTGQSANRDAITYRDCTKGICRFTQSESWFPCQIYTPKCAFDNRRSVPPSRRQRPLTGSPPMGQKSGTPPTPIVSNVTQPRSNQAATTIPATAVVPETMRQPINTQSTDAQNATSSQATGTQTPPAIQSSAQDATACQATGTQKSKDMQANAAPPTYEEAISQSPPPLKEHTEQPKESEPSEPITSVCLLVRFRQEMAEEFKATMVRQKQSLYTYGGELIMLAIQPIATSVAYYEDRSIAIFLFEDESQAVEWFTRTPEVIESSWLGGCTAYLGKQREQYQPGKGIFSFSDSERDGKKDTTNDVKQALKDAYHALNELKQAHNGTSLLTIAKKDWTLLRGDEPLHNTSIVQWSDMGTWIMYMAEVKSDAFKRHMDVIRATRIVKTHVILQSVNLEWLDDEANHDTPVQACGPGGKHDDVMRYYNGNDQEPNHVTQVYRLCEANLSDDLETNNTTMSSNSAATNNVDNADTYPELIDMDKPRLVRHVSRNISTQDNQHSTTEETEPKILA